MDAKQELSKQECRDLLAEDVVGRVGFVTPFGPRVVPVNYVVTRDAIEVRTTPYSELGTYAPGSRVAFEIDHLDRDRKRGWSVVAHGRCERAVHPDEPEGETWAGGHRALLLRITWDELSGRRVGGPHWPHPVVSPR